MNDVRRVERTVTQEEIDKVKSFDWAFYYKSDSMEDSNKILECPACEVMIFPPQGSTEFVCKRCGEKILL